MRIFDRQSAGGLSILVPAHDDNARPTLRRNTARMRNPGGVVTSRECPTGKIKAARVEIGRSELWQLFTQGSQSHFLSLNCMTKAAPRLRLINSSARIKIDSSR